MGRIISVLVMAASASVSFLGAGLLPHLVSAHATPQWSVSGDVSLVPHPQQVAVAPLEASAATVSADAAVKAAGAVWGLSETQIDPRAGVVRCMVSKPGDPIHQHQKAWAVVVDQDIRAPGTGVVFHKLVILVDATTGRYLWAYSADPGPA